MKCPTCNIDLVMSERMGVEIDYCPQCRGVWLDRGELDKIISKSSNQLFEELNKRVAEKDYSRNDDDTDNRRSPGKKRRESFLGDLFDF